MSPAELDAKQRLIQAAKGLFATNGYDATSVRQICEEAGVNLALVSYHFGGKEQLFKAIFEEFYNKDRLAVFDQLKGQPVAAMKAFVNALIDYRFDEPDMTSLTMQEVTMRTSRVGILFQYIGQVWILLRRIIVEGKEQGVFVVDSVDYTMTAIMGMLLFPPRTNLIEEILDKPLNRVEMKVYHMAMVFRTLGAEHLLQPKEA